jgi:hypothetical protein
MASVQGAYGFIPVNLIGGRVFAGSTRMYPIASGYNTSIFFGDAVKPLNTGFIQKDTGTSTMQPVGIFMGVQYVDPVYGLTFRQSWTAGTVPQGAAAALAFVCDDPDAVFRIQADASMSQSALFQNAGVTQGAGNATNGNSGVVLATATINTTNTLPLRIIGWAGNEVFPGTAGGQSCEVIAPGDAFPDVLVTWNSGTHFYRQSTGV